MPLTVHDDHGQLTKLAEKPSTTEHIFAASLVWPWPTNTAVERNEKTCALPGQTCGTCPKILRTRKKRGLGAREADNASTARSVSIQCPSSGSNGMRTWMQAWLSFGASRSSFIRTQLVSDSVATWEIPVYWEEEALSRQKHSSSFKPGRTYRAAKKKKG